MSGRTQRASRFVLAAALLVNLGHVEGAHAQATSPSTPARGGETPPDVAARAKQHFQRGRELYQAGSYREAIGELEQAHTLDPHAKDLVYNLAVVNEKLGQIDAAIQYLHVYLDMDLDPQERAKADAYVKRLEGAKKEVVTGPAVVVVPPGPAPTPPGTPPEEPMQREPHGRVDAATVTVASVAVVGVAVGAIFGVKALADRPSSFVTGKDGTYQTLLSDQQHAHTEAIVSDVGFGVGVAAAAIAAYLYFGRTKAPARSDKSVSIAPLVHGGPGAVLVVGGSF